MKRLTIEDLRKRGLIIFEGRVGSHAYGIATENSDEDSKGVFVLPLDDVLGMGYVEQVNDEKNDRVFYELKRFLELLEKNNPTVLELLFLDEEDIIQTTPAFEIVRKHRHEYLTKKCQFSFGEYASAQIGKARGLNKKIMKPLEGKRKSILEFCHVAENGGSVSLSKMLEEYEIDQKDCGLVAIPHVRYTYAVYHPDFTEGITLSIEERKNFSGICKSDDSNDVSLSSVPKGMKSIFTMYFNKDGYSTYCREYKEYKKWEENRNPARFSDNMLHGKGYDGKNMAHCLRLLETAREIAEGKGIIVKRPDRDKLLSIRRGEYEYDDLIEEANAIRDSLPALFENSSLPSHVSETLSDRLLIKVRKFVYKLEKDPWDDGGW
jgi:hypothetical protein